MNDEQIAALAKGMVPFVRQCVNEATAALLSRLAEIEARPAPQGPQGPPGPKGDGGELAMVPPEIAEQVASAVRLLHESSPQQRAAPQPARVARIERDAQGNLIPIYD